jgi:hypothetical protein
MDVTTKDNDEKKNIHFNFLFLALLIVLVLITQNSVQKIEQILTSSFMGESTWSYIIGM